MSIPSTAEPVGGKATAERVRLLIEARRAQDALRVAFEGLQADPDDAELMGLAGWALLVEGDAARARAWAEQSLLTEPAAAWVHDLRARALLDGAGQPGDAVAAARIAVEADPGRDDFLFTLVRACLESRDRAGAEQAVQALRQAAPVSALGPLAAALVAMDRGRVYFRRRVSIVWLAVLTVVTQGSGLVMLGAWWVIRAVWRAPHLRRADALLHEALRMDPGSVPARAVAAEVLRLRFRVAQSVDYEVAAAAIEAGLIDANSLARSISRRTTSLAAACSLVWVIAVAVIDRPIQRDAVVALIGAALAVAFVGMIAALDRWQTRSLPPVLLDNVRARWPLPAVAMVATGVLILAGVAYVADAESATRGYDLACLVTAPLAAAGTAMLLARFVGARRGV